MTDSYYFDTVVIGSGVIGLSTSLELQSKGHKVLLVEKNPFISEETSSRNSGVIHSGIYYPEKSLKKHFCIRGNELLYEFCKKHSIPYKNTGKLIVANENEELTLMNIYKNGVRNGISENLQLLKSDQLHELEPNLSNEITSAIYVKSTGIVDQPSLTHKIQYLFEKAGGQVTLNTTFHKYRYDNRSHISYLDTIGEIFTVESKNLILCTGLHSYETGILLGKFEDLSEFKKLSFVKGHYYKLNSSEPPFRHLIYPIPSKLGLGIHYTLDIDGFGKFGPDTSVITKLDYGFNDTDLKKKFYLAIKKYYSGIKIEDLSEDYTGIRPKLGLENKFYDFSILEQNNHGYKNLFFLQGFDSPGFTSSFAIAEYISKKL